MTTITARPRTAYRLLASFYNRTGDVARATRVLTALDLLGFAEDTDRNTMQRLRANEASGRARDRVLAALDHQLALRGVLEGG